MPTSSFTKKFVIDSEQALRSFEEIIYAKHPAKKVDRSLASPETVRKSEEILEQLLKNTKDE